MKKEHRKIAICLLIISLCYTYLVNCVNIHHIKKENPQNLQNNARSLVYNSTIYSIDNYWYVNNIKNFISSGRFTVDTTKKNYEVRRTPVYPIFYGLHYMAFGEEKSYYFIRFTQAIILALATVFLFFAVFNFTQNKYISLGAALLYCLQPGVAISAYFTNSESLSSELVCFLLYSLSLCKLQPENKKRWLFFGFLFALGALCRPTVIFLAPSCLFAVLYFNRWDLKKSIFSAILFCFGAAVLFLPWTIRNYFVTNGDVVLLEKYYGDPMDYGMPNIYLRKWIACWINPADYSSERISNTMRANIALNEPAAKEAVVDSLISALPPKAYIGNHKPEIRKAYLDIYEFYRVKHFAQQSNTDSIETVASNNLRQLKTNFIKRSPLDYYIITPILFAKSVIFQSNSTSLSFVDNYHGDCLKIFIKGILYLINVLSFLSVFFLLFYLRKYADIYWLSVLYIACTFFVIIYILQYFENRYTVPLYPFMYTLLSVSIYEMYVLVRKWLNF
ncbi:MAG: hypothetical protein JWN78_1732 [Bacteroidota bacterium]|nr:hypothetical protein [Bacteroidota bacterium]